MRPFHRHANLKLWIRSKRRAKPEENKPVLQSGVAKLSLSFRPKLLCCCCFCTYVYDNRYWKGWRSPNKKNWLVPTSNQIQPPHLEHSDLDGWTFYICFQCWGSYGIHYVTPQTDGTFLIRENNKECHHIIFIYIYICCLYWSNILRYPSTF